MMADTTFSLIQGRIKIAEVTAADRDTALREILHYAYQYIEDGPVTIREKRRRS